MPKGIPANKGKSGKVNMMEAVRRVLEHLGHDAKPLAIKEAVRKKYGHDMTNNMISNYKSTILKKAAAASSLTLGSPGLSPTPQNTAGGSSLMPELKSPALEFDLEELVAIKELVDRIGAEKVLELAKVLAK